MERIITECNNYKHYKGSFRRVVREFAASESTLQSIQALVYPVVATYIEQLDKHEKPGILKIPGFFILFIDSTLHEDQTTFQDGLQVQPANGHSLQPWSAPAPDQREEKPGLLQGT